LSFDEGGEVGRSDPLARAFRAKAEDDIAHRTPGDVAFEGLDANPRLRRRLAHGHEVVGSLARLGRLRLCRHAFLVRSGDDPLKRVPLGIVEPAHDHINVVLTRVAVALLLLGFNAHGLVLPEALEPARR
jgi:hypothetical protein